MAANTDPIFGLVPVSPVSVVSAANTGRDGSGTLVSLVTGDTDGTRVEGVQIKATGETTAGMVRFFIYDGSNNRFFDEVVVSAITPGDAVKSFGWFWVPPVPLVLPLNYVLKASTHNEETFHLTAIGADFS